MFVTKYLNPVLADKFKDKGIQFIDPVGNDFIKFDDVYVYIKGNRLPKLNTEEIPTRAFKPTGLKMIFIFVINAFIIACLKHIFNLAIKWKMTFNNPANDVKLLEEPPGRTRFLLKDEISFLLNCSPNYLKNIIIAAINTGMRISEILGLMWKQVRIGNAFQPYIELRETKNNKIRNIPLNKEMIALLSSLKENDSKYVFLGPLGYPIKSVHKFFKNALEKAVIEDFRFHDLRHTFASYFIMSGGNPRTLKRILGHSTMKMVERYTHLKDGYMQEQIDNLSQVKPQVYHTQNPPQSHEMIGL